MEVSALINRLHTRHIHFMQQTLEILGHVLAPVSQEAATSLRDGRDGPKGWSVLEVVCHLCDFDELFRRRAEQMLQEEHPTLEARDHEALAKERAYNSQNLAQAYAELVASRRKSIAFFESLSATGWQRTGIHPVRGHFTMSDALIQFGMHDTTHLEQITRILYNNDVALPD